MGSRQLPLFAGVASHPTLRDVADAVREAGLDGLPDAQRRADQARYQEVHVRSAMARAVGMPFTWTLNPYRGCTMPANTATRGSTSTIWSWARATNSRRSSS